MESGIKLAKCAIDESWMIISWVSKTVKQNNDSAHPVTKANHTIRIVSEKKELQKTQNEWRNNEIIWRDDKKTWPTIGVHKYVSIWVYKE
jgi:hypothetical protein